MKNWVKYMGFLGLLGLLGLFTSNPGFYGFFGFFGCFAFSRISYDERFELNVNKACRNAFILSVIIFALVTVYVGINTNPIVYAFGFALSFALQWIVFSFSLQHYEKQGIN